MSRVRAAQSARYPTPAVQLFALLATAAASACSMSTTDDLDVLLVDLEIRAGVGKSFHPNKPPNFDRELAPACTALRSQEFLFCLFVCYF